MPVMDDFWKFTEYLVSVSAEAIMPYWDQADLEVIEKQDDTPVTRADRGAEAAMRKVINERYPEHGIIGEEYGEENSDAEYVWVLDPIDGTLSFTHHVPLFGTLVCLKHRGVPVLGAINQPVLNKCVIGDGEKTVLNGKKQVYCSTEPELSRATLLTTDPRAATKYHPKSKFSSLVDGVRTYRTWGDAFGYLAVATGGAEIMVDPIPNEWDFAGHIPIIRGAGGAITDWYGNDPLGADSVIAANPHLHGEVLKRLHDK